VFLKKHRGDEEKVQGRMGPVGEGDHPRGTTSSAIGEQNISPNGTWGDSLRTRSRQRETFLSKHTQEKKGGRDPELREQSKGKIRRRNRTTTTIEEYKKKIIEDCIGKCLKAVGGGNVLVS